jgi:hypothetical protein
VTVPYEKSDAYIEPDFHLWQSQMKDRDADDPFLPEAAEVSMHQGILLLILVK